MSDFLAAETQARQWLVPGLLERMDRTVITGAEGGGKSVLCSQIAACLAGGVHPFGGNVMGDGNQSVRVLVIDCENSDDQSRRRYRWVIDRVKAIREQHGHGLVDWNDQMRIDTKPAGIDLLSGRDISWLENAIQSLAPDLLVLGPLYKLHHRDPSEETSAREVAHVIDGLRERHGFALLTEAHAGNSNDMQGQRVMRPIGSSLWRRWPEFGFGIRRAKSDPGLARASMVDVVSWRGSREERAWPASLQHGAVGLPWIPDAEYYDSMNNYE
ncbi:AAA family ATPase [Rhodococcus sp. RCBS9]|nr:AAA family ATPase [Rhodococcus sp. RCBS9]WEX07036.1 AAA family ATPase [Rhodococcus sp. RCBS9]WEX07038.1 AAA family ATPase [Rhodococcus sp. RCBS9]